MKVLFVFTCPPDRSQHAYSALHRAAALAKREGDEAKVFLSGDGASCGRDDEDAARRFGNIQQLLSEVMRSGGEVGVCATCMDARGIEPAMLRPSMRPSTSFELCQWTEWADEVVAF